MNYFNLSIELLIYLPDVQNIPGIQQTQWTPKILQEKVVNMTYYVYILYVDILSPWNENKTK